MYFFGSFLLFLAVFGVDSSVGENGDDDRGYAACYYQPEEVGVADCFLDVACEHARNHHAQRHERGADSIVGCLELAFGEVHHIEHIGCKTEAVTELFDSDSRRYGEQVVGLPYGR